MVYPELSLTGYRLDVDPLEPADHRLRPLVETCGRAGSTALAGAVVHDDARRIAVLEVTGGRLLARADDEPGVVIRATLVAAAQPQ